MDHRGHEAGLEKGLPAKKEITPGFRAFALVAEIFFEYEEVFTEDIR